MSGRKSNINAQLKFSGDRYQFTYLVDVKRFIIEGACLPSYAHIPDASNPILNF